MQGRVPGTSHRSWLLQTRLGLSQNSKATILIDTWPEGSAEQLCLGGQSRTEVHTVSRVGITGPHSGRHCSISSSFSWCVRHSPYRDDPPERAGVFSISASLARILLAVKRSSCLADLC